jgi:hypothetical protein
MDAISELFLKPWPFPKWLMLEPFFVSQTSAVSELADADFLYVLLPLFLYVLVYVMDAISKLFLRPWPLPKWLMLSPFFAENSSMFFFVSSSTPPQKVSVKEAVSEMADGYHLIVMRIPPGHQVSPCFYISST